MEPTRVGSDFIALCHIFFFIDVTLNPDEFMHSKALTVIKDIVMHPVEFYILYVGEMHKTEALHTGSLH